MVLAPASPTRPGEGFWYLCERPKIELQLCAARSSLWYNSTWMYRIFCIGCQGVLDPAKGCQHMRRAYLLATSSALLHCTCMQE